MDLFPDSHTRLLLLDDTVLETGALTFSLSIDGLFQKAYFLPLVPPCNAKIPVIPHRYLNLVQHYLT